MKKFNVIVNNFNTGKFEPYDVIPYLVRQYNEAQTKPVSYDEFLDFVKKESMYQWWSRCEYEIILLDWPCQKSSEKWDVYKQIFMNLNVVTDLLIESIDENQ